MPSFSKFVFIPVLGGEAEQLLARGEDILTGPVGILAVVGSAGHQLGIKLPLLLGLVEVEAERLGLGGEGLQMGRQPRNQFLFHGSLLVSYAFTNSA